MLETNIRLFKTWYSKL